MTVQEYDSLVHVQKGCCAICGRVAKLVIDHVHGTGAIRGLLCSPCNVGLGMFREDVGRLARAIQYVTEATDMLPQRLPKRVRRR